MSNIQDDGEHSTESTDPYTAGLLTELGYDPLAFRRTRSKVTSWIIERRYNRSVSENIPSRPAIRQATQEDAQPVQSCVAAAFEIYIERIGRAPAPMLLDFPALIAARQVWVAELEGQVVGVVVQYETEMGFYLDTVAVKSVFQGRGIGKALMQFAEQEALRRGYDSIYLCTHATMTENRQLYPKIGYVEFEYEDGSGYDRVYFRKPLNHA